MRKVFYGWYVCLGCALIIFCTSGLCVNAFTVYQPYIIQLNGFTNAQASTIITVRSLFAFASMFLTGFYYKKISYRVGVPLACLVMGLAFALYGAASTFIGYCLAAMVAGLAYGLGTMIPLAILLERWFVRQRSLAISLCSAATGLSTLGIPNLITALVEAKGLRFSFFAEAAFIALLSLLAFLLLRNTPSDMGLQPYGADELPVREKEKQGAGLLRPRTWLLLIPMLLLLGGMTSAAFSHLSVLAVSNGFSAHVAALSITAAGIMLTLGKLAYGWLNGCRSTVFCNWVFGAMAVVGLSLLCLMGNHPVLLFVGISLYGAGLAFTTVGLTAWVGDWCAEGKYDSLTRWFQIGYAAGGLAFSSLPGIWADRCGGSYVPAFVFFAFSALVVLLIVQGICFSGEMKSRK